MVKLRKNPHLYQINLMTWLRRLSEKEGHAVTLNNIPSHIWADLKGRGMDLVWLMGMWHRSRNAKKKALKEPTLVAECRSILDDFQMEDLAGSPYAIDRYTPDPAFGTTKDLLGLKEQLTDAGLGLILDFVPNHTACDHPWLNENPEYFIQTVPGKKGRCPEGFFPIKGDQQKSCTAHGRDPYFDPWNDTAQLDYANPDTARAMIETLTDVTRYCHGLRCDMAMLVLKKVFNNTWKKYLKQPVKAEFWRSAIKKLREQSQGTFLMAEVYWGMEQDLFDLGFDFTYDKTFYDLLINEDINGLREHLQQPIAQQEKMVRFLENHDEPRAMKVFGPEKIKSAMVTHGTLPGMRFWHHGQFEGCRIKVPVQLNRAPAEPIQRDLKAFSEKLLHEVDRAVFHEGAWAMCEIQKCSNNPTYCIPLAWCWRHEEERRLIVINLSPDKAVGMVKMPDNWLPQGEPLILRDPLKGDEYVRSSMQVAATGLYVELEPRDYHFLVLKKK